ncbi:hypothetical protein BT69DRAFT_129386 [Atractiella rhizophila]|nr:hypothetical protein BT69DRAFT_129386 [Atractiella rhizophila]
MMNKAVGYQTDSVHFALVLSYYGLLRSTTKSNTSDGELLYVDGKRAYINYCRLIYRYVRPISRSSAPEALQYLYTISFHSDYAPEHNAICKSYIKGLVVETSDSSALVGQILPNGDKREGQLQKDIALLPTDGGSHFLKEVINAAAERAEEEKRFSDAIHLYHLSEDYDAMISVLNIELGNSLSRPLRNDGMGVEDETLSLAKGILGYVQSSATIMANLKRVNKETAEILIQLCDVLTLFERAEYQEALNLQSIRRLGVVPLDGDLVSIIRKADEFKELDPAIARNFDNVLLATMTILSRLHEQLKDSPYGEEARQNQMAQLRSQGKALVMFASMLRYRMLSSDTFSELTRLDVSMR